MLSVYLLGLLALSGAVESARILAFLPLVAKSHHFAFRPVIEELAKRGHEVVYVTGLPYDKPPANVTQIDIVSCFSALRENTKFDLVAFGEMSVPKSVFFLYEFGMMFGDSVLSCPRVQKLLQSRSERFDVVMAESYFVQEYQSALIHHFGAVGVEILPLGDSSWVNEMSGLPDNTAYQIDMRNENTNVLDFWGRLYSTYVTGVSTIAGYIYLWRMQSLVDKYFNATESGGRPCLLALAANRSLILTNSHHSVGYSVPLAPHRKEIGGINVKPNKPLPRDLQIFMDTSPSGVIFMSLGSNINVSDVTNDRLFEDFMSVFASLPHRVLMKWEKEGEVKVPQNVKLAKWFPQQDILAHKKLRLFITHGGILSIFEAVHYGVPLMGIPFFGDQVKNLKQVEAAGYGRVVRYRNLTRESISWAVNELLSNPKYKEEAVRRSGMLRDRVQTPAEEAAYWVEYVLKYPGALTPRAVFLPFYQLHRLDTCAFLVALALAGVGLVLLLCCLCRARLCKTGAPPASGKKLKKN